MPINSGPSRNTAKPAAVFSAYRPDAQESWDVDFDVELPEKPVFVLRAIRHLTQRVPHIEQHPPGEAAKEVSDLQRRSLPKGASFEGR